MLVLVLNAAHGMAEAHGIPHRRDERRHRIRAAAARARSRLLSLRLSLDRRSRPRRRPGPAAVIAPVPAPCRAARAGSDPAVGAAGDVPDLRRPAAARAQLAG